MVIYCDFRYYGDIIWFHTTAVNTGDNQIQHTPAFFFYLFKVSAYSIVLVLGAQL